MGKKMAERAPRRLPPGTHIRRVFLGRTGTSPHSRSAIGGALAVAGALALVVGAFLPWITASAGSLGTVSQSGVGGGDGWFFIGGAALTVLLAWFAFRGPARRRIGIGISILGLVGGALVGVEFNDAHNGIQAISGLSNGSVVFDTSYGVGLYLLAVGVAAILAGGLLAMIRSSSDIAVDAVGPVP